MGKNPGFYFYPSDWTRDLDDQDLEIEGAWIRICCRLWWSETRGEMTKPLKEWSRILRKTEQKTMKIFQILIEKHIADGNLLDNQNVNLISRRMKRDYEISQTRQRVGALGGNPVLKKIPQNLVKQKSNQKRLSSTSTSYSNTNKELYSECVLLSKDEYQKLISKHGQNLTDKAISVLNNYIMSSGKKYKSHYHTLLGWPLERATGEGDVKNTTSVVKSTWVICPKCKREVLPSDLEDDGCIKCLMAKTNFNDFLEAK